MDSQEVERDHKRGWMGGGGGNGGEGEGGSGGEGEGERWRERDGGGGGERERGREVLREVEWKAMERETLAARAGQGQVAMGH